MQPEIIAAPTYAFESCTVTQDDTHLQEVPVAVLATGKRDEMQIQLSLSSLSKHLIEL